MRKGYYPLVKFFLALLFLIFALYTLVNIPPTYNDPLIIGASILVIFLIFTVTVL